LTALFRTGRFSLFPGEPAPLVRLKTLNPRVEPANWPQERAEFRAMAMRGPKRNLGDIDVSAIHRSNFIVTIAVVKIK